MIFNTVITGGSVWISDRTHGAFSSVFLLTDEKRKVLIDTSHLPSIEFVEEGLKKLGINPEEITDIVLTHVHLDHAFNSIFFENAKVYIHENYAKKDYLKFGPLIGKAYYSMIKSWEGRIITLKGGEKLFDSIEIIHTPYHSKEHISLFIESENMGKLFLPGDICMTRLDYYDVVRGLRNDKVAEMILNYSQKADYMLFTHDELLEIGKGR